MTTEQILHRWTGQLERLTLKMNHLAHVDDVFWQIQAIIAADTELNRGDVFQRWIGDCYVSTIVTGLRSVVDRSQASLSVSRLLDSMGASCADVLTRERFVAGCEPDLRGYANRSFDALGGRGLPHIPRTAVEARRHTLKRALEPIVKWANEHLTHLSQTPGTASVTFHHARMALVEVFGVVRWCTILITGGAPISPVPVIQSNWLTVFGSSPKSVIAVEVVEV